MVKQTASKQVATTGTFGVHIIQYPTGKFGFIGSVPASLSYARIDGMPLTEDDVKKIKQFGPGLFRKTIKSVAFDTLAEAEAAWKAYEESAK